MPGRDAGPVGQAGPVAVLDVCWFLRPDGGRLLAVAVDRPALDLSVVTRRKEPFRVGRKDDPDHLARVARPAGPRGVRSRHIPANHGPTAQPQEQPAAVRTERQGGRHVGPFQRQLAREGQPAFGFRDRVNDGHEAHTDERLAQVGGDRQATARVEGDGAGQEAFGDDRNGPQVDAAQGRQRTRSAS